MSTHREQRTVPYINSLTPATNISFAQSRITHQNPSQDASPEEEMQRQSNEFRRSITIIIWYKAKVEPVRLHRSLPGFPYFQFTSFPCLINDLHLTPLTYLDTYIPDSDQWEQHQIGSVRIVDTQQRLLYKVRPSLLEGLADEDCVSFNQEMQMQKRNPGRPQPQLLSTVVEVPVPPSPKAIMKAPNPPKPLTSTNTIEDPTNKNPLKRPAQNELQDSGQSPKIHVPNNYYLAHNDDSNIVASSSNPITGPTNDSSTTEMSNSRETPEDGNVYMFQPNTFFPTSPTTNNAPATAETLPHYLLSPHSSSIPIPYRAHPPLKRWPNDYTVSELSEGFHAMDALIQQSSSGANMTQRTAFERVFGSRYVKSTVCRHRAVWRKAHPSLRQQFEAMGTDDRACWGEFVRVVEGRPPGKASSHDMIPSPQSSNLGYHDRQDNAEGDDLQGTETVLSALQNQVTSPSNNPAMQNGLNVYDPSRNHLGSNGHPG